MILWITKQLRVTSNSYILSFQQMHNWACCVKPIFMENIFFYRWETFFIWYQQHENIWFLQILQSNHYLFILFVLIGNLTGTLESDERSTMFGSWRKSLGILIFACESIGELHFQRLPISLKSIKVDENIKYKVR